MSTAADPVILVLEDMPARVRWLREQVPEADIRWSTTVADFLGGWVAPDLVILDHDLGGVPRDGLASRDAAGLTGMDAAERMPGPGCPVVIWSVNPVHAPEMAWVLMRRGVRAAHVPFGSADLAARLARWWLSVTTEEEER